MPPIVGGAEDRAMARRDYVFDYEAEPADERPTGYGDTAFGHSTNFGHTSNLGRTNADPWGATFGATAPAPWAASEHSTFEQPSHAIERVHARRQRRRLKAQLAVLFTLLGTFAAAALVLVRPWGL
jgi:hypothetical protein